MRRILLLLSAAALVTGCGVVTSLESLSAPDEMVFDPKLLGAWRDDSATLHVIITPAESREYFISMTDTAGNGGRFVGQLTRLDGRLVLDVTPEPLSVHVTELYRDLMLPLHAFLLLDVGDGQLIVRIFNEDSLQRALETEPGAPSFISNGGRILLTAPREKLRPFLSAFADRPGVVDSVSRWRRP